jgi:hypothetical protein
MEHGRLKHAMVGAMRTTTKEAMPKKPKGGGKKLKAAMMMRAKEMEAMHR